MTGAFAMARSDLDRLVRAKIRLDEAEAAVLGQPAPEALVVVSAEKFRQAAVAAAQPIARVERGGRACMEIVYRDVPIRHPLSGRERVPRGEAS